MIYILILIIIVLSCDIFYLSRHQQKIIKINTEARHCNEQIEIELNHKQQELKKLQDDITSQTKLIADLNATAERVRETAAKHAQEAFARASEELKSNYVELESSYQAQLTIVQNHIKEEEAKLQDLKDKQAAYIAAKQREEEKEANVDYYRLVITISDQAEIKALRQLQQTFLHKEAIDKLVWEVYYKPAFDALSPHFFKSASDKKCGIYKITNITTGAAYIGQSIDLRERWRQHIKTALSSAPATNLLYQAMKRYGVEDFTFEILEEVPKNKLNDREAYWITFWDTKERGLNKTQGNTQQLNLGNKVER